MILFLSLYCSEENGVPLSSQHLFKYNVETVNCKKEKNINIFVIYKRGNGNSFFIQIITVTIALSIYFVSSFLHISFKYLMLQSFKDLCRDRESVHENFNCFALYLMEENDYVNLAKTKSFNSLIILQLK